jgi:hypothetical protein
MSRFDRREVPDPAYIVSYGILTSTAVLRYGGACG